MDELKGRGLVIALRYKYQCVKYECSERQSWEERLQARRHDPVIVWMFYSSAGELALGIRELYSSFVLSLSFKFLVHAQALICIVLLAFTGDAGD